MKELRGAAVFIAVWMIFAVVADYVLGLGANSWRMLFGYCAGLIASSIADALA